MKKVGNANIVVGGTRTTVTIYTTDEGDLVIEGLDEAQGFQHEFEEGELFLTFNQDNL